MYNFIIESCFDYNEEYYYGFKFIKDSFPSEENIIDLIAFYKYQNNNTEITLDNQ